MADEVSTILQAGERCIILFERDGNTTEQELTAVITGIPTLPDFKQDFEGINVGGRQRLYRVGPKQDGELVIDVVVNSSKWHFMRHGWATSGDIDVAGKEVSTLGIEATQHYTPMMRVSIWIFANNDRRKAGGQVVPPATGAIQRYILKDCFAVEFSAGMDFGENMTKGTITFRAAPYDEQGQANFYSEYTAQQSTAALTVLGTKHGGTLTFTTTSGWAGAYT